MSSDVVTALDQGPLEAPGDAIDGELLCIDVQHVTHDVTTFVLEAPRSASYTFDPGQYVTVSVDVDGQRVSRCYSISSPPTRPGDLAITVKRVPGGPVSNWLHDHLSVGDLLDVSGPLGVFSYVHHPARKQLYLSAGSGITPLISMARTIVDRGEAADVVFVHHARTPADIVFRHELARLPDLHPGIRVEIVCETDSPDETWTGHRGRISPEFLTSCVADLSEREVFACGPAPYRDAARSILLGHGVSAARLHEESYVLEPSVRIVPVTAPAHTVEFRRSQRIVECPAGTTVLEAASLGGVPHPSSCQEGVCGTCKTTLLSGAVDMQHRGGIRPREIAQNKILPCCSVPTEDIVLDA